GINLLREGLDIPEVALITILDADKEGFLRSATALIQTCGRAARNVDGRVIMYADKMTKSIDKTIETTMRRRKIQEAYNKEHNIKPRTIKKALTEDLASDFAGLAFKEKKKIEVKPVYNPKDLAEKINECEREMKLAAKELRFEEATRFRDLMRYYQDIELLEDNPT
ncbi:MAG: UvrB/UvrC motif-containing protein, partial [Simkaniaceae bacterium]|nr:UvrB/UvrC motif-containing protein [Simkaniaceae bacterium]